MIASVTFPWPPAALASNARVHWRPRARIAARVRGEARILASQMRGCALPAAGDIPVAVTFRPPSRRGDRLNFPHLAKVILDGVADALGVDDWRFAPAYAYGEPVKGGEIIISIGSAA
jgi:crossover junction endodeoxyribonuclease RusA